MEYYTKLERGAVGSVSEGVLDGLVHALQLDEAERDHLYRLVRTATTPASRRAPRRTPAKKRVRPAIQQILDQMPMPAYLRNGRFDVLAANEIGRALYSPLYDQADAGKNPNSARFLFLDPAAPEFFVDYDKALNDCVAFLRAEAGRDPYDKELSDLIGELLHPQRGLPAPLGGPRRPLPPHRPQAVSTTPSVGDLELDYEAFELPGDPGQRINVYTAPPDSPAEEALNLLASWTLREPTSATPDPRENEDTWNS